LDGWEKKALRSGFRKWMEGFKDGGCCVYPVIRGMFSNITFEDWLGSGEDAETGDEDEEDTEEDSSSEDEKTGTKRKKGPVSKAKPKKKFSRMEIEYEEEVEAPQRELALA